MNKVRKTAYNPDYVSAPGETLVETLEMLGLSQAELGERTGRPKKAINEIAQGKAAITPETAVQFELVLGVPATFLAGSRIKVSSMVGKHLTFLADLPLNAMTGRAVLKYGSVFR